jgi:hypothetical protein
VGCLFGGGSRLKPRFALSSGRANFRLIDHRREEGSKNLIKVGVLVRLFVFVWRLVLTACDIHFFALSMRLRSGIP